MRKAFLERARDASAFPMIASVGKLFVKRTEKPNAAKSDVAIEPAHGIDGICRLFAEGRMGQPNCVRWKG